MEGGREGGNEGGKKGKHEGSGRERREGNPSHTEGERARLDTLQAEHHLLLFSQSSCSASASASFAGSAVEASTSAGGL